MKPDSALLLKFIRFGCIGGVVYLFDASCFYLLFRLLGMPTPARAISVALAMTLSWWLNRTFTFHAGKSTMAWTELVKFMLSQLPGACINGLVSVLAFGYLPLAQGNAWIATALGSCAGLCANFVMAHVFVFNHAVR